MSRQQQGDLIEADHSTDSEVLRDFYNPLLPTGKDGTNTS